MDDEHRPEDHRPPEHLHTKDDIFSAVYYGMPIACEERDYPDVRRWLGECAAFWTDEGQGIRAFIALNEIKRLDQFFEVTERED